MPSLLTLARTKAVAQTKRRMDHACLAADLSTDSPDAGPTDNHLLLADFFGFHSREHLFVERHIFCPSPQQCCSIFWRHRQDHRATGDSFRSSVFYNEGPLPERNDPCVKPRSKFRQSSPALPIAQCADKTKKEEFNPRQSIPLTLPSGSFQ